MVGCGAEAELIKQGQRISLDELIRVDSVSRQTLELLCG
jgi:hypothetical protein